MGLDYEYAYEKLAHALEALATSPGRIQERLYFAAVELSPLRAAEHFPENLRDIFQKVSDACTKPKSGDDTPKARKEGTIKAACDELTDEEGSEIAALIFRLYDDIDERQRQPWK